MRPYTDPAQAAALSVDSSPMTIARFAELDSCILPYEVQRAVWQNVGPLTSPMVNQLLVGLHTTDAVESGAQGNGITLYDNTGQPLHPAIAEHQEQIDTLMALYRGMAISNAKDLLGPAVGDNVNWDNLFQWSSFSFSNFQNPQTPSAQWHTDSNFITLAQGVQYPDGSGGYPEGTQYQINGQNMQPQPGQPLIFWADGGALLGADPLVHRTPPGGLADPNRWIIGGGFELSSANPPTVPISGEQYAQRVNTAQAFDDFAQAAGLPAGTFDRLFEGLLDTSSPNFMAQFSMNMSTLNWLRSNLTQEQFQAFQGHLTTNYPNATGTLAFLQNAAY